MNREIDRLLQTFDRSALRQRGLLDIHDLSDEEMLRLLDLAAALKQRKRLGTRGDLLQGKNIALVFEKMSTRTRAAAVVAVADEGGTTEYLSASEIHIGKKESVKDTARVLGRLFDGILFRGYSQQTVAVLAQYAGVPVWNGLTDESHPTQTLADLLTIRENFGRLADLKVVYVGDGRNNVANSLMAGCVKAGIHFVNCTPESLTPRADLVARAEEAGSRTGGSVSIVHDPLRAVEGANAVYTDVWVSMGEESKREERIQLLWPYQVTPDLMRRTGNLDSGQVIFLHCLPAFHDRNTSVTKESGALEVADEVFEAPYSRVFDQAENRMHTIKAMVVASLR